MVVDDDVFLRDLTTLVLRRHGFDVLPARDGMEALEMAAAQNPQLILLDLQMPRLDGREVARRLRADPQTLGIPIIFLSALPDEIWHDTDLPGMPTRYLTKPFNPQVLVEMVQAALETDAAL